MEGDLVVIDDFLANAEFAHTWRYFRSAPFRHVHERNLQRVFRLHDGEPLQSDALSIPRAGVYPDRGASSHGLEDAAEDATATLLFPFIRCLLNDQRVTAFAHGLGDWAETTVRAYLYSAGVGLGWHADDRMLGAFAFYAHPSWHSSWGGELLAAGKTGATGGQDGGEFYGHHDDSAVSSGTFVVPKTNRLVLIPGGVSHCIKKVDPAAGAAVRASVSGFFLERKPGSASR